MKAESPREFDEVCQSMLNAVVKLLKTTNIDQDNPNILLAVQNGPNVTIHAFINKPFLDALTLNLLGRAANAHGSCCAEHHLDFLEKVSGIILENTQTAPTYSGIH